MTAATTAARTVPPAPSTETAANCEEPPKVVADITTAAMGSKPAARASTPNETPNSATAMVRGAAALRPSR